METDSSHKELAWTDYFVNKSILMRLMKWAQMKFLAPKFAKVLKPYVKAGDKVLDAGCGTATNTLYVCSLTGTEPWGLDISEVALGEACRTATRIGLDIRLTLGDIQKMPFPDKSFDVVWNQGVLEHFKNADEIISEMARVGRMVFVAVPRLTLSRELVQRVKTFLGLTADDVFYLYKESQLVELMSRINGLTFEASGSFSCLYLFSWTWACGITDRKEIK